MEIEYINEDTIRVRIKNTDLEDRGFTFLDLLGDQQQIEEFFYKILEEVDLDNQFKDSEAVTFQVMPNPTGLELLISKDSEVHENMIENVDFANFEDLFLEQELEEIEKIEEIETHEKMREAKEEEILKGKENIEFESEEVTKEIVIEFNNFEQIIQLAQTLKILDGFSSLYQLNEKYYIDFYLVREDFSFRSLEENIAIILEYGRKSRLTSDVLSEHGDLLIEDDALDSIYYYFKE